MQKVWHCCLYNGKFSDLIYTNNPVNKMPVNFLFSDQNYYNFRYQQGALKSRNFALMFLFLLAILYHIG